MYLDVNDATISWMLSYFPEYLAERGPLRIHGSIIREYTDAESRYPSRVAGIRGARKCNAMKVAFDIGEICRYRVYAYVTAAAV